MFISRLPILSDNVMLSVIRYSILAKKQKIILEKLVGIKNYPYLCHKNDKVICLQYCAKISLEPVIELVKNEGMKPKDLKKAMTLCETFKEDFIEKWHEHMDDNE